MAHQVDERQVVQRVDQVDRRMRAEQARGHSADVRVQMHRIDDLHIPVRRQLQQPLGDTIEAAGEILPPVAGDQDQPLRRIERGQRRI